MDIIKEVMQNKDYIDIRASIIKLIDEAMKVTENQIEYNAKLDIKDRKIKEAYVAANNMKNESRDYAMFNAAMDIIKEELHSICLADVRS